MSNKDEKAAEIDLLELFGKSIKSVKNTIKSILLFILGLVVSCFRRWYFIAGFAVIAVIGAYALTKVVKPAYSSYMLGSSLSLNSFQIKGYIDDLGGLAQEQNYAALSEKLGLDLEIIQQIKAIHSYMLIDVNFDGNYDYIDFDETHNLQDTTSRVISSMFCISLDTYDNSIFEQIRARVYDYLTHSTYVKQLHENKVNSLKIEIVNLDREIAKLDSLQSLEYFQKEMRPELTKGQLLVMNEQPVRLYHSDILSLKNRRQNLINALSLHPNGFAVIKDFTVLSKQVNTFKYYAKKVLPLFLIIGLIAAIFIDRKDELLKLLS